MVPFHSQVYDDESSQEEEIKEKEKSVALPLDSGKEISPSEKLDIPSNVKLDLKHLGAYIPPLQASKNGMVF